MSAEKPKPKAGGGDGDKYQKISHIEHILLRPDTYIGSIEFQETEMWVYNSDTDQMEHRKVNYVPGLYKIFDEVLVNAADNKQNDKNMDEIRVTVDRESGEISVWNNGRGIPIEIHKVRGASNRRRDRAY
jgi:DNA topoisomerase-2